MNNTIEIIIIHRNRSTLNRIFIKSEVANTPRVITLCVCTRHEEEKRGKSAKRESRMKGRRQSERESLPLSHRQYEIYF